MQTFERYSFQNLLSVSTKNNFRKYIKPEFNIFYSPEKLSGRNDATSDKVNFGSDRTSGNFFFLRSQDISSFCGS